MTCEDLFHALASNASTVVLPKVPSVSNMLQQQESVSDDGSKNKSGDESDSSSSLAETVSESSSIPSHLPTSVTLQSGCSNMDERDDGYALSSICSEDNCHNLKLNSNKVIDSDANCFDVDDYDDFNADDDNGDTFSDSPPIYCSPKKNINSLLSDNSEVEIDFSEDPAISDMSPNRSGHHVYQEEQRYLFEHGNIVDEGLEDDSPIVSDNEGVYECDRFSSREDSEYHNTSLMTSFTKSPSPNITYDAMLRKLLGLSKLLIVVLHFVKYNIFSTLFYRLHFSEATIVDVIVEAGMEVLTTPVKNKLNRDVSNFSSSSSKDEGHGPEKVLFTNSVLKKMCRAVAIELSLELRSPSCELETNNALEEAFNGGLKTAACDSSTESISPTARDIEKSIWPVFASFLNAEESDEMVMHLVDSLASLIFDNTLQPLYCGIPDIEGVRKMSDDFESNTTEEVVNMNLTSLAEVRAAVPSTHLTRAVSDKARHQLLYSQKNHGCGSEEEAAALNSGTQTILVNQYLDEIRNHEHQLNRQDNDTPVSRHEAYSISATVDSEELDELCKEEENENESNYVDDDKTSPAPWNIPPSPMDDIFRRTHNSLGSPYQLPADLNLPDQTNHLPHNDMITSPSPMEDLVPQKRGSSGARFRFEDEHNIIHPHHEDYEFYDDGDYAKNLYGSGGYVIHSPDRRTPDRSVNTTDALASQSVLSQGGMLSSTSSSIDNGDGVDTVSSPLTHDNYNDTVSSPLTHDNYNSSPGLDNINNMHSNFDIDEESSTNSLSMRNLDGDHDDRRGGVSVSNTTISSPSISTRRSDAITVSDLPDNFGSDFFANESESLERISDDESNSKDCDPPTPSTDTLDTILSASNLQSHYSSYEMSMLDHLDKIANSPGKLTTRSTSLGSSNEDNLIVLPKSNVSPLSEHQVNFFGDINDNGCVKESSTLDESDTSTHEDTFNHSDIESESSIFEESNTSQNYGESKQSSDESDSDSQSQQQSLQTDAAVIGGPDEQELRDREYNLYGYKFSPDNGKPRKSKRKGQPEVVSDSDFSDQIPLPGESYEIHQLHNQHPFPASMHSQNVMSPSELHISQQDSGDRKEGYTSSSIYSKRLAQSIPLTSFSQVLYNNEKTASQSYSDNSENRITSNDSSDDDFVAPPSSDDRRKSDNDAFFTSPTSTSDNLAEVNRSLNPEEEAEEDVRLFNDIVASMGDIDPYDETAQSNAFFMAELMRSTLNEKAMSFYKESPHGSDQHSQLVEGTNILSMEEVGNKLDAILQESNCNEVSHSSIGESSPHFDQFGLQVDTNALNPAEYGSTKVSKKKSNRSTVSGDILMKNDVHGRRTRYMYENGVDEDAIGDSESEFERSSTSIRSAAIKQFSDMVQRYAAPMDLSPLKKNDSFNKDFFSVMADEDSPHHKDIYDSVRESTIRDHESDRRDMIESYQSFNDHRPTTAKTTPKLSLKGTSPSTNTRKQKGCDNNQPSERKPDLNSIERNKLENYGGSAVGTPPKKLSKHSSSPSSGEMSKSNGKVKGNSKLLVSGKKASSKQDISHIVVIPPVPMQLDVDNTDAIYSANRDIYCGPTAHEKFGVDFNSSSHNHIQPGGNPPPAFSPTSPTKAAGLIQSNYHKTASSSNGEIKCDEKRSRPKSAPRIRTPGKTSSITSNSATAAVAARRAAKDPATLLRKSTTSIPSSSGLYCNFDNI